MENDTLSPDELRAITGRAQAKSQAAALARLGLPFQFTGRAVLLERAVARAHALLPKQAAATRPSTEDGLNAGLRAWQAERRAEWEAGAADRAQCEIERARRRSEAPIRRRAANTARGAVRKASEATRTPPWADMDAIRALYVEAGKKTRETGVRHHVDHVIPLRGRLVSGLHVHHNLAVIPASENMRKSNRFEP